MAAGHDDVLGAVDLQKTKRKLLELCRTVQPNGIRASTEDHKAIKALVQNITKVNPTAKPAEALKMQMGSLCSPLVNSLIFPHPWVELSFPQSSPPRPLPLLDFRCGDLSVRALQCWALGLGIGYTPGFLAPRALCICKLFRRGLGYAARILATKGPVHL